MRSFALGWPGVEAELLERIAGPLPRRPARRRPRPVAAVVHVLFAALAFLALAAFVVMFAIVSGLYELDGEPGRAASRPASASAAPAIAGSQRRPASTRAPGSRPTGLRSLPHRRSFS